MFPVSTMTAGLAMAFPDVCKVPAPPAPPVPSPFPNVAQLMQAVAASATVKVLNQSILTKISQVPSSQGDNGGVAMGTSTPLVMSFMAVRQASTKLNVEGNPALLWTHKTSQNGNNAPMGNVLQPSQTVFFCAS